MLRSIGHLALLCALCCSSLAIGAEEARSVRDFGKERVLLTYSLDAYQLVQLPSGQAGFWDSSMPKASGEYAEFSTKGTVTCKKTTGIQALKGGRAYWDHSANSVTFKRVNDRDFYVGRYAQDATASADQCEVILNIDPPYDIDLLRDPFISVLVGTPAAGGFGYPVRLGGALVLELTATSEAQKVDALSVDGFARTSNAIVELRFRVISDGAGTEPDFSLGVANGTHASDADSIAESVFIHLDGNNTNINAESDDGTTEVAATDTTTDYTEGSDFSKVKEVWIDFRDEADVQIYVDGVLVLSASTFNINAANGPLYLLAHLEKTSSASTYKVAVDRAQVRFAEQ